MNKPLLPSDDLLVKYVLGEALPDERLRVEQWLADNAANRRYYQHFKLIWDESKKLSANIAINEAAAWQQFTNRIEERKSVAQPPQKWLRNRAGQWLSAAAVLLLVAISVWLYNANHKANEVVWLRQQTASNTIIDTVSDGSIITLNKNTVLQYPSSFTGNTRNVTLKGEAFFKVASDKAKPFIIQANDVTITVVGTAFNVKNYDSATQIIVESGVVRVTQARQTIELHKGEQTTITNSHSPLQKVMTKDSLYQYYRTKEFVCNNTLLPLVLQSLSEVYHTHLAAGSNQVKQLRLSATFKEDEEVTTIIGVIAQTFNLQVVQQGDSIILEVKKSVSGTKELNR